MYAIIDAAIQRSRTTLLILAMVVIAGIASDKAILVESEPHIEVPFFVVTIPHEGISPEDSERLLVMPMETEMRSIEGIKELTSYSSEGAGTLVVEFNADYPLQKASIDVRDAVDRAKAKTPEHRRRADRSGTEHKRLSDHPGEPARRRRTRARAVQHGRSAARRHRSDSTSALGRNERAARRSARSGDRSGRARKLSGLERAAAEEHRQQQPSDTGRRARYRRRSVCGESAERHRAGTGHLRHPGEDRRRRRGDASRRGADPSNV